MPFYVATSSFVSISQAPSALDYIVSLAVPVSSCNGHIVPIGSDKAIVYIIYQK